MACNSSGSAGVSPTVTLPPIDPRLTALGDGSLSFDVPPRQMLTFDPLTIAAERGLQPPACADFVFLIRWETKQSSGVKFAGVRQGTAFDIASGRSGEASFGGCIELQAVNESDSVVHGDMRFVVATSRQ